MSIPRLATSVATSILTSPVLRSSMACSLSHCSLSPWILWQTTPASDKSADKSSATLFFPTKIITLSSSARLLMKSSTFKTKYKKHISKYMLYYQNFKPNIILPNQLTYCLLSSSLTIKIVWVTECTAAKSKEPTYTWIGFFMYLSARARTSSGQVALKKKKQLYQYCWKKQW